MKKLLALIFAWLYVFTLSGVTLNFHFCGDSLNCVSLFTPDDCCACSDEGKPDCCNDEGIYLKATDDSHTSGNYSDFSLSVVSFEAPAKFSLKKGFNTYVSIANTYQAYDLPPPQRIILFRRLLI